MQFGYTEIHGDREAWFDTVEEAKNWAENQEFAEWDGRSGLKSKEADL